MPLGGNNKNNTSRLGFTSKINFTRKKTYSVQDVPQVRKESNGLFHFMNGNSGSASRRCSAPPGNLKRGGLRSVPYLALADGMVPQEMAAAVPMPREPELNELFAEMVVRALAASFSL